MKSIQIWSLMCILLSVNALAYNINIYESEPNNTKFESTLLPYNYTIKRGNINSLYDEDWYKVNVNEGSSLIIRFDHPEDNFTYNLYIIKVFDSADTLLSQRYVYAPDESITYEVGLGNAGDFYVVVETACDDDLGRCEFHRSDEYTLSVSVFNADDYLIETEPNDTVILADDYSNGGIATGQIAAKSDVDFFKIKTNGAADIKIDFYHIADNFKYNLFYVQIIDGNNVVLNSTTIYAPDGVTNLGFSVPSQGYYYMRVSGCQSDGRCDSYGSTQYTLKTLISPLDVNDCPKCDSNGVILLPIRKKCE